MASGTSVRYAKPPLDVTRFSALTSLSWTGPVDSWATTGAPPPYWARAAIQLPATSAPVTTTMSLIRFMGPPPWSALRFTALLDRSSGDAGDELVEEEVVDDGDRHPDEQGARHQRSPEVDVATNQLGGHAQRNRLLAGEGDEGQRVEEILHREREGEDDRGDEPRPAYRQDDTAERAELAAAVHHRRFLDLERHCLEEAHEEPGTERDGERRIHDHERPPAVLEVERADDPRQGNEQDDRRHQVREEDPDPQVLGEREAEPGQRIAGGDGGQERDDRHPERDGHGVDDPGPVRGSKEQQVEVLQRRRHVEPEGDDVHPVEIRLLLERGDRHPEDREDGEDQERYQAEVDQDVPPDFLDPMAARGRDRHRQGRHQY